ncbi:unnamed protein product [Cyprideis torosa]|uniref:Outer membrane protein assembly factor BamE domain-containing protein n=1 Tax=Cyprideis torosa TaxID=163714 RepID=A0A7R8WW04_9CRUS|nr:unnamed protein product [Cyprideis torosa]CAG0907617.1 unnamed protein product [Cyprideis torosa]
MKVSLASALLGLSLTLSGCYYKIDIPQGTIITAEQFQQIELGMSRQEVRRILGTPLVDDPFHNDRWDYPYQVENVSRRYKHQQVISVMFDGDTVVEIFGETDLNANEVIAHNRFRLQQRPRGSKGVLTRAWEAITE